MISGNIYKNILYIKIIFTVSISSDYKKFHTFALNELSK